MILGRDARARSLARLLERDTTTRHTLVRANALTCTHHVPGRTSTALSCTTCNGTGYTDGVRADLPNMATLGAPYNTLVYIAGEIQMGHGLRGAGGSSGFTDGDRGTEILGDAVFYFRALQRDPITGAIIAPVVGASPRPDRIIRASDNAVFTVLHDLDESYGTSALFRAVVLGLGIQGAAMASVQS